MVAVIIKSMKVGVLLLSVLGASAHAGFVDTDWKVSGDGQATLHEETGIEWLKLSNTVGTTINQVLGDVEYAGWRLPTNDEVEVLLKGVTGLPNIPNGPVTLSGVGYASNVDMWMSVMGTGVYRSGDDAYFTIGRHVKSNSNTEFTISGAFKRGSDSTYNIYNEESGVNMSATLSSSLWGVFLVSDGGTTLSSRLDPSLNANNPAAPEGSNVVNVSAPVALSLGILVLGISLLRRKV